MTDRGDFILVDSAEVAAEMTEILKAVEQGHRRIRIMRDGKAVAEMSPVSEIELKATTDPELKVVFSPDYRPDEGLDSDVWPEDAR
jgi:antitoxin (DNA-binding transcriptional repressor) of toxin-antitoxin stability system